MRPASSSRAATAGQGERKKVVNEHEEEEWCGVVMLAEGRGKGQMIAKAVVWFLRLSLLLPAGGHYRPTSH